jgi:hypothetical protein
MFKLADNGYTDIIIYILIMVGGLIANAYKNYSNRKGKEKQTSIPTPRQRPIFPEVIFKPVFEYPEPDKEQEILHEEEIEILDKPKPDNDILELENIPALSYIEGEAVFENTKNILISDSVKVTSSIENEDLTTIKFFEKEEEVKKAAFEFDVAQAVIYSEILKPNYF